MTPPVKHNTKTKQIILLIKIQTRSCDSRVGGKYQDKPGSGEAGGPDHRNGIDLLKPKSLGSGQTGALHAMATESEPCFKLKFSAIFYSNFFDLRPSFSNSEKTSSSMARRKFYSLARPRHV